MLDRLHVYALGLVAAMGAAVPLAPASRALQGAAGTAGPSDGRAPNLHGRIPILEYHVIGDHEAHWTIEPDHFRHTLEMLYERGYRPVSMAQLLERKFDLAAGLSPVVFTFDDASPSQFRYIERDGTLEIDSNSALGIWLDFHAKHPDWENHAVFCMLPAASAGHAFFGDHGIEGQQTAWRFKKVQFLARQGFELCDHTLWHANLGKYSDAVVQEQIARGAMAIDSAVPGYRLHIFALPLGIWPKNRELARAGSWTDPKTGREIQYRFDAVLEVSGGPAPSPYDATFNPLRLPRVEVYGTALEHTLDDLDRNGTRFVSAGPDTR